MTFRLLVASVVACPALWSAGCGGSSTRSSDMPVVASPGVNPKTGKVEKKLEVSLEDPNQKK